MRWAQHLLQEREGADEAFPEGVVRACFRAGLLSEAEAKQARFMVNDRNLTVHTYNEALADAIHARIPGHARLMRAWLDSMRKRASARP